MTLSFRLMVVAACAPTALTLCLWDIALPAEESSVSGHIWTQLVKESASLGLPTRFLREVPSQFVKFEFDDLQAFAAEYHPGEHRMVLNRSLSFNAAGGTLRPLNRLTHTEIETLYHELFHAFMDYAATRQEGAGTSLEVFARKQQRCRYSVVLITPVVQRPAETEERFLSDQESWEALNEAWAVFIGWAVWSQLESGHGSGRAIGKPGKSREAWLQRLSTADQEGKIRGYYEPSNPEERLIARKRYLAGASRVSSEEISYLMQNALGYPLDLVHQAQKALHPTVPASDLSCG
ncbi:conserved exported protein of unknown function [Nitrospira sp. KM1]|uniref:hypothetical protein n=1 Tax=Nitrospira sp. KM1 TaxID=1936990 RepID=UPI0013A7ADD0|nr:hypothetical protein [Nitrospira sp. KM1]BCA56711.1 conserved exported protein of unknown function [Nitrospira sp. KM1]